MPLDIAEQLDKEANELFAQMTGTAPPSNEENSDTADDQTFDTQRSDEQPVESVDDTEVTAQSAQQTADTVAEVSQTTTESTDDLDALTVRNAQERIRNAQARMTRATEEAAENRRLNEQLSQENAYLRSQVEKILARLPATPEVPPQQPGALSDNGMQSSAQTSLASAIDEIADEFPEIAAPIRKALIETERRQQQLENDLRQANHKLSEVSRRNKIAEETSATQAHNNAILAKHADAFEIAGSDDFQGWLDRQPDVIKTIMKTGSANDVNWMLDQYKMISAPVTTPNPSTTNLEHARRIASPSMPSAHRSSNALNAGKPKFTSAEIAKMSLQEFAEKEAEIDAALAAGLVI